MKIGVITPRFALAGVPLAQIRFARALARRGHDVKLIVGFADPQFTLPDVTDIDIEVWNFPKVRNMLWPLMRYLRKEQPNIIFSAEDHMNTIVLIAAIIARSNVKISGSSRVTPFDTYSNSIFSKRWVLKQIIKSVMWRANVLTCVSKDMVQQYNQIFKNPPHVAVYNITDDPESRSRMRETVDHKWLQHDDSPIIVAAGRLAPWKGFSDLIAAISLVKKRRNVRLLILGDGSQRHELQVLIEKLDLGDTVDLVGYVANPLKYFVKANVFVLSSLVEGLPNVLVEAMMCGCTPVSTDCPTGPREVLQNGKYGYLVPIRNPSAMADAIELALDYPIPKSMLDEAVAPFEANKIIDRHFELLGIE